ncbi:hypothetical protein [Antarcticirhabdus aurantiaca]|uniref:hypothetical protein n=1 Tax=Antarcticirhabdus aurantiaca TaxID=2606717 RepID=UPI00131C297B|nr:hypothetical protein [Antarcticirhabdus aurantiaca]
MIQPFTDLDERALKTLTGELVSAVGGTASAGEALWYVDAKGERRAFSEARISGYCTPSDMSRSMPIRQVVRLEIAAKAPIVSRWMLNRTQRDGSTSRAPACVQDLHRIVRETSDLHRAMCDATDDDGQVNTAAEKAAVLDAITDLRRVLDDLEAKVV